MGLTNGNKDFFTGKSYEQNPINDNKEKIMAYLRAIIALICTPYFLVKKMM